MIKMKWWDGEVEKEDDGTYDDEIKGQLRVK
jgi:hypothetical protein